MGKAWGEKPDHVLHRWRIIQEALATEPRTKDRRIELERASRKWGVSKRTLQRWIHAADISGGDLASLARKRPANAGRRRVWVSRAFDRELLRAGLSQEVLEVLGRKADQLIRAAWASPAQRAGWKQVRREVVVALQRFSRELQLELPPAAFQISQRRVREARHFRIVDVRANDRKSYDDGRPRIRRRNDLLRPMQQVVMDVKVIDCCVRRSDGTVAWPRMVAFMDVGTQRIFRRFFLLGPGQGIRQEHVVTAFLDMVSDHEWGFPEQIYRDNGSSSKYSTELESRLSNYAPKTFAR